jgi:hypothetical protein
MGISELARLSVYRNGGIDVALADPLGSVVLSSLMQEFVTFRE